MKGFFLGIQQLLLIFAILIALMTVNAFANKAGVTFDFLNLSWGSEGPGYDRDGGYERDVYLSTDSVIFSETEPKVTESQISAYLEEYADEKLKHHGPAFYRLGEKYDIDPAFAIAVSSKETTLGKLTCSGISKECNNFFCIEAVSGQESCGRWAKYGTVEEGIEAFYSLIRNSYVDKYGQDTIAEIGCAPGSGVESHCYCVCEHDGCAGVYCPGWVGGYGSVPYHTENIRTWTYA